MCAGVNSSVNTTPAQAQAPHSARTAFSCSSGVASSTAFNRANASAFASTARGRGRSGGDDDGQGDDGGGDAGSADATPASPASAGGGNNGVGDAGGARMGAVTTATESVDDDEGGDGSDDGNDDRPASSAPATTTATTAPTTTTAPTSAARRRRARRQRAHDLGGRRRLGPWFRRRRGEGRSAAAGGDGAPLRVAGGGRGGHDVGVDEALGGSAGGIGDAQGRLGHGDRGREARRLPDVTRRAEQLAHQSAQAGGGAGVPARAPTGAAPRRTPPPAPSAATRTAPPPPGALLLVDEPAADVRTGSADRVRAALSGWVLDTARKKRLLAGAAAMGLGCPELTDACAAGCGQVSGVDEVVVVTVRPGAGEGEGEGEGDGCTQGFVVTSADAVAVDGRLSMPFKRPPCSGVADGGRGSLRLTVDGEPVLSVLDVDLLGPPPELSPLRGLLRLESLPTAGVIVLPSACEGPVEPTDARELVDYASQVDDLHRWRYFRPGIDVANEGCLATAAAEAAMALRAKTSCRVNPGSGVAARFFGALPLPAGRDALDASWSLRVTLYDLREGETRASLRTLVNDVEVGVIRTVRAGGGGLACDFLVEAPSGRAAGHDSIELVATDADTLSEFALEASDCADATSAPQDICVRRVFDPMPQITLLP